MSTHRYIRTSFWDDSYIVSLTPEERYFYMYLLTNPHSSQCGIYELPIRVMVFETSLSEDKIKSILKKLEESGKIKYNYENSEMFLLNWPKFNWSNSPKVISKIKDELKEVKTIPFVKELLDRIKKRYSMDTVPILYPYSMDTDPQNKNKSKSKNETKLNKKKSESENENKSVREDSDSITETAVKTAVKTTKSTGISSEPNLSSTGEKAKGEYIPPSQAKDIFEYYKRKSKRGVRLTDGRIKKCKARLKVFTSEEIKKAIDNLLLDGFMTGENNDGKFYATFDYLVRNDENVDKWLNTEKGVGKNGTTQKASGQSSWKDENEQYRSPRKGTFGSSDIERAIYKQKRTAKPLHGELPRSG